MKILVPIILLVVILCTCGCDTKKDPKYHIGQLVVVNVNQYGEPKLVGGVITRIKRGFTYYYTVRCEFDGIVEWVYREECNISPSMSITEDQ